MDQTLKLVHGSHAMIFNASFTHAMLEQAIEECQLTSHWVTLGLALSFT